MIPSDIFLWMTRNIECFVLVLIRISTLLFMFPIFSSRTIPLQIKVAISIILSMLFTPVAIPLTQDFPVTIPRFLYIIAAELFLAMVLSLMIRFIFAGIQVAGQMVGIQMGLGVANIMDPQSGTQSIIVAQFAYTISLLLFLVADGHHALIRVVAESFTIIPPGLILSLHLDASLVEAMVSAGSQMFALSVKLMAPVMGILLITQVALGILAKLVPQINMLMISLNLNVGLGLLFFGFTMHCFWPVLGRYLRESIAVMPEIARIIAGG